MLSRMHRYRELTLLLLAAILIATLSAPATPAARAADSWGTAEQLTSNQSLFPDVVIDSNGVSHVVFAETPDFNTHRAVRYINNSSGQWSAPFTLSAPGMFADLPRLSTMTVNGQVYVAAVYKARPEAGKNTANRIYYRLSTDGGQSWGAEEQVTTVTSFEPSVVLDPTGQPHIAFSYQPGSSLQMAYTTRSNGSWTKPTVLSPSEFTFNRDADITYTLSNGTLSLHILFEGGIDGKSPNKHVYYTRKIGIGGWSALSQREANDGGEYPELASDYQNQIFGVWHNDSKAYGYEPYFGRSTNNGSSWSTPRAIGTLSSLVGGVPTIARAPNGKIAVIWEDQYATTNANHRDIYSRISTDDGVNWSDVLTVYKKTGVSRSVETAAGTDGFRAVWHDNESGSYQILTNTYGNTGPVGPVATFDKAIASGSVGLKFSSAGPGSDAVRWRWGAKPSDATNDSGGWQQPFNLTTTYQVTLPQSAGRTSCDSLQLYVQVRQNGNAVDANSGNPLTVTADQAVQATVRALNPYMAGLPKFFPVGVAAVQPAAADDGDPTYTRIRQFVLEIDGRADCVGLASFAVTGGDSGQLSSNFVQRPSTLPGDGTFGAHDFHVSVVDKLFNPQQFPTNGSPFTLIYDPANTDTTGTQPNTDGLPKLNGGSVSATGGQNVFQTLTFNNVNVSDNLYRSNNSGTQFWGVWIANSTDGTIPADDSGRWVAVKVASPSSTFNVSWNLLNGLNYADPGAHPGTYTVFVRFLDGAGNPSTAATAIKTTVALNAGYKFPTLFQPLLAR